MNHFKSSRQMYNQLWFRKIKNRVYGVHKKKWSYFLYVNSLYKYLLDYDPDYTENSFYVQTLESIKEIIENILVVLEMFNVPAHYLFLVMYFSNKFVYRAGITYNQIFNLMITSTIITLNDLREDSTIDISIISDIFNIPVEDINIMENIFLTELDFDLGWTMEELELYNIQIDDPTSILKQSLPPQLTNNNINMKSQETTPPASLVTSAVESNSSETQDVLSSDMGAPSNSNLKWRFRDLPKKLMNKLKSK
ncbi:hypothetical protein PPL_04743 [Heterostelium album PN500]|uniref:Uncharacterized protein n=1 Tax=Heterostelium pallidum (strain ATCC 26659 / Pp 5 / PN500) TaxID=670386 RepID=D3B8F0_HETP5|nr:hypothetical protein PPL_04743 [Heterostelium album PN500]EFA82318.1 hypothetical protein PPL_04743 [Heterostelium album PN500]|eukprot:XP_020434435.1 hypothetical protein PPL_04743 [Heterostelium album PN500]